MFGCNVRPFGYRQLNGNLVQFFNNPEPGGCTWSQAGVWGLNLGAVTHAPAASPPTAG